MTKEITINGKSVSPVDLKGRRVVSFAMIDDLHQRPEGTASRNFRSNKKHFSLGEDYVELTADEIRRQSLTDVFPPRTPKGILLTESGYLMLVKPFTDDLAWNVQRELVNVYFRAKGDAKRKRAPAIDTVFARYHRIASLRPNADPNQCWIAAGRATYEKCGENPCETLGITSMEAPDQTNHKTVTEIGKMIGMSGQAVNKALIAMSYQVKVEGASSTSSNYEMLERGKPYGRMYDETRKRGKGAQQVLKWSPDIAEQIKRYMDVNKAAELALAGKLVEQDTRAPFAKKPETATV
ncbi:phage-related DNA binding protein [Komagataeibacter oboediens DSM 11826]|uniref:KilA-N DNA-binding domain-containing protein n=1 Tax=Komagataeibacter oboediens TaxID=65958 RepID=A0A318QWD9_9PROT|nr:ORF6N domain-containing protein [Komagataeibacter oboediens]PYD81641.1 hypothetical protein CFR80_10515 [Komagataeibacter oboediens]GBR34695.1 phage-related DNA binding protein [Komagataeibacter oboediens DSM 11826]